MGTVNLKHVWEWGYEGEVYGTGILGKKWVVNVLVCNIKGW